MASAAAGIPAAMYASSLSRENIGKRRAAAAKISAAACEHGDAQRRDHKRRWRVAAWSIDYRHRNNNNRRARSCASCLAHAAQRGIAYAACSIRKS